MLAKIIVHPGRTRPAVVCFLLAGLLHVVLGRVDTGDEHFFRHQQHYSHRLEQVVDDFKTSQTPWNGSWVSIRHDKARRNGASATTSTPRKHHLRHHNRHHQAWEQRVFPALHPPRTPAPLRVETNTAGHSLNKALNNHYFDRAGLYSMPRQQSNFADEGPQSITTSATLKNVGLKGKTMGGERSPTSYGKWTGDAFKFTKFTEGLKNSLENSDEYFNDDESEEGDYSDEEDDMDTYGDAKNKIADRTLLKRQNTHEDFEDIYSRSYTPGTLTRHKIETLGTHEAVKQSRKSHTTTQKHHRVLANAHASKVYAEARCRLPKPQVEKIQKDPSKVYVPHCTILHKCGDDTGCCTTDAQTCVPKVTENVDLYFFVKSLKAKHGTIERHSFVNHTECHCVDKSHHHKYSAPAMLRKATILDCNCPRLFEKVLQENGVCRCDCSSGNSGCDWLKRGMEHFSMVDRKCIIEGRCRVPTCEYGNYVKRQGRCPRKDDNISYSMNFH